MGSELELYDARLSYLRLQLEPVEIHLSYAHIHKTKGHPGRDTGRGWSQEAILLLAQAHLHGALPPLPNTIVDGYLETAGQRFELLPLPFEHSGPARLHLEFGDGSTLELHGSKPHIRLEGKKVFLEDYI